MGLEELMPDTPASRPVAPDSRGFTLLELVVVVFIVSLALAVVAPTFSTSGGKLKAEAREAASIVRYISDASAMRKTTLALGFDLDKGVISWAGEGRQRRERFDSLRSVELPSRGEVREGELVVFFPPIGLSEHLYIHLALAGEEMTVSFNPISRRTKIVAEK